MAGNRSLFAEDYPPLFVDGIGPPLQQIEQDWLDSLNDPEWGGPARDMLALIAEIKRLRDSWEGDRSLCECGHAVGDHDQFGCLFASCRESCKRRGATVAA